MHIGWCFQWKDLDSHKRFKASSKDAFMYISNIPHHQFQDSKWRWMSREVCWGETWLTRNILGAIMVDQTSNLNDFQFSSVQSLSCVWLFVTPWITARQASLSIANSHVHQVGDAIQPSHPLSSPSPPAPNPSQHQGLFQWVNSSHEVAKVLEFQLQHQSFQWTPRTDLL